MFKVNKTRNAKLKRLGDWLDRVGELEGGIEEAVGRFCLQEGCSPRTVKESYFNILKYNPRFKDLLKDY